MNLFSYQGLPGLNFQHVFIATKFPIIVCYYYSYKETIISILPKLREFTNTKIKKMSERNIETVVRKNMNFCIFSVFPRKT